MEKVAHHHLPNSYRIQNGRYEVVVATDAGPRILRYGPEGGPNVLGEYPNNMVETELGEWRSLGGHRLWAAPEGLPFSYAPDHEPLEYRFEGELSIHVSRQADAAGVGKEMVVSLDPQNSRVEVLHKLINARDTPLEVAAWALTVFRGGTGIMPLEPFRSHGEALLPSQPIVLWPFSDLTDPRFSLDGRLVKLTALDEHKTSQKVGLVNKRGWSARYHAGTLFVKRFGYQPGEPYPDFGANNELYAEGEYLEVETLGPLKWLAPGESVEHLEQWELIEGVTPDRLDDVLRSLR